MVSKSLMVALAGSALAASALAGPNPALSGKTLKHGLPSRSLLKSGGGVVAQLPFSDNFDSYKAGSGCAGNGTWELWDPSSSPDGLIVNTQSNSAPNALELQTLSDNIQRTPAGTITKGKWLLRTMTYFPTGSLGESGGMLIGLNTFDQNTQTYNWSFDIGLDYQTLKNKVVLADEPNGVGVKQLDLIVDKWVELRVEIDLDANNFSAFYNGENFVDKRSWTEGSSKNGILEIQCCDFYSAGVSGMLYDDVSLSESKSCYADCDGSGELDIDDFICFQTAFGIGDSYADCDASGELDIDDFICFQTSFGIGCGN
jgi:hypothetical protein